MEKIKALYQNNPILLLLGVALLVVLLSFVWGTIVKSFSYLRDSVKGSGSTLSKDEAQAIANSIYQEIHSMFTNENYIVNLLIGLSSADYYKVKAEFGIKRYNATLDEFNFTGEERNLTEILNLTLSENDKERLKQENPQIPLA